MGYSMMIRMELVNGTEQIMKGQEYNVVVTNHGIVMLFYLGMGVLVGGFGNYLVPLMIGAADMAYPRINNISFWMVCGSYVMFIMSGMIEEGPGVG